ncbi:carbohydrate kinase [Pseudoxanthomonas sp. PXM02]|uniref:carbohydrate kinase family protein n=1 Tax=Pseudoxanthomonas sp. PXM02 TaxID=2769294 RepID=UPI00177B5BCB|nr:carbohydrate kinase [Pseudoxanthomonas sp. PXM02]MBD9477440.1 carbohydrate kinase [Pseudoxanthomonas sp. PXM02]
MSPPARKIVCFGEALIDMLAQPPATPDAPRNFLQYAGGAPANVAVAAARLGADVHFAGMLGNDMFGDFLFDSLASAGVATDCIVRTDEAKTALAFVALDEQGERSFSFYRPPAADLLFRAGDFTPACFEGTGVFHVCSNSLTEAAIAEATYEGMRLARAGGAVVSIDLNLRPALWPHGEDPSPRLWQALAEADLVKLSREELEYLAGPLGGEDAVMARLWQHRAQLLVITDGAKPIHWYTRAAHGSVETFQVTALDTTAAGDAFVGGMLFNITRQSGPRDGFAGFVANDGNIVSAIRFGSAVGALAVTRKGAFAAMPSFEEVGVLL